jgi:hypothetical protein
MRSRMRISLLKHVQPCRLGNSSDGTSMDCNGNGRPDECAVGFDPRVTDFNYNLVPDECEADVSPPPASFGADLDRAAIAAAMDQWWAGFDYRGLKAWKIAYEIKQKFAGLGFDLRTTVTEGGTQP